MDKISLIKRAIWCFVLGLLGLIPVLGLPFALSAWICGTVTARKTKGQFNPAKRYIDLGRRLGFVGFCVTSCICLIGWYIAAQSEDFFPSSGYT